MSRRCELVLPDLGMGSEPVTVSLWLVATGASVTEGDRVIEILTGAATVDLAAPADGVLIKKLVEEDEPVHVGQVLGLIEGTDPQPD